MDGIIKLKGGSLNSTCLHNDSFVRKTISTKSDREYGYVRWYSQLKKLQRFDQMFPSLVPRVLDVGVSDEGLYFDIEYIKDSNDIKTLFTQDRISDVKQLNVALWEAFDRLHSRTYSHNASSLKLYFVEEVEQKLNDARKFPEFDKFFLIDSYSYNDEQVHGVKTVFDKFKELFTKPITTECYVHGNPTLENILYNPVTNKITFIDLYEEGIVDSKFMDYSQVLQCSNSYYGLLNDSKLIVEDNNVSSNIIIPLKLVKFNKIFKQEISNRYSVKDRRLIDLFEATQFFRMLPFKCHAGNIDAAKFFYVHACRLVNRLL